MIPTAFTKTLRELDQSRPSGAFWRLGVAASILAGLGYWMVRVPVALYETSSDARLEIDRAASVVQAAMTGKIVSSDIALGRTVQAGDVLVRMDSLPAELQVREAKTRLNTIQPEIESLRAQIAAEESAGVDEQRASQAAVEEARLKVREAETQAQGAQLDRQRYEKLLKEKLVPEREYEKIISESERLNNAVATTRAAIDRLTREQTTRDRQRAVRIAQIRTDITKLESGQANTKESIRRVNYDVEQRVIRAPISGTIGEATLLRPGSVLSEGARVASIVPAGQLRVVALFAPQAVYGRVKPGAGARLRLKGYPWTEFGVVDARVTSVAGEDRDGRTRVELEVLPSPTLKAPLVHGMPGELEIEIEKTPPWSLVMRTAGQWLTGAQ
jgi:multidrug resistance efflux pump